MTREQWAKMSDEERRVRIARICGWDEFAKNESFANITGRWRMSLCRATVPNYLNDINAMHDAEKSLIYCAGGDREMRIIDYTALLDVFTLDEVVMGYSATAAQRAEAFILTMEKEVQ